MKITIYEHITPEYALQTNEHPRRICVALKTDDDRFIDSFDYNQITNQIRFYGESQHYDWDKVPKKKLKLWKTNDLRNYIFYTRSI